VGDFGLLTCELVTDFQPQNDTTEVSSSPVPILYLWTFQFHATHTYPRSGKRNAHSKKGPETAQKKSELLQVWWAQQDLNLRPSDYESPALTAELWALQGIFIFVHDVDGGKGF
jgi:hypothetical protein